MSKTSVAFPSLIIIVIGNLSMHICFCQWKPEVGFCPGIHKRNFV